MKLSIVLIGLALQSILKNKMRAMLTMLGIVIGVAAVIVMVAVGYGARSRIHEQINSLGTNMIVITPGASTSGGVSQGAQAFATLTAGRRRQDPQRVADRGRPCRPSSSAAARSSRRAATGAP